MCTVAQIMNKDKSREHRNLKFRIFKNLQINDYHDLLLRAGSIVNLSYLVLVDFEDSIRVDSIS